MKIDKNKRWMIFGTIGVSVAALIVLALIFWWNRPAKDEHVTPAVLPDHMEDAYDKLAETDEMSDILTGVNAKEPVIALTFDGMTNTDSMLQILDILEEYNVHATFFCEGILAAEDSDTVKVIAKAGHVVASYSLDGGKHLEEKSQEDLLKNFYKTNEILQQITNQPATLLKCNVTEYTDELRHAAWTAGNTYVVQSDLMLSARSFKDYEQAAGYVSRIRPGAIVSFKLAEELSNEEFEQDEKPAEDLQAGLDTEIEEEREVDIVQTVRWFVQAVAERELRTVDVPMLSAYNTAETVVDSSQQTEQVLENNTSGIGGGSTGTAASAKNDQVSDNTKNNDTEKDDVEKENALTKKVKTLRAKNDGKLANVNRQLHMVSDSVAFAFYGIENEKELDAVLKQLKRMKAGATFFVNEYEADTCPKLVQKIDEAGYELGIAVTPKADDSYISVAKTIYRTGEKLAALTGQEVALVFQPWDEPSDVIREAASALGYQFVSYDSALVKGDQQNETSAQAVINRNFNANMVCVHQGQILYFRMNYYKDHTLLAKVLKELKKQKIDNIRYVPENKNLTTNLTVYDGYDIVSVGELLQNEQYTYPLADNQILPEVRGAIGAGHLNGIESVQAITKAYLGNLFADEVDQLPGFTQEQIDGLDVYGALKIDKNEIFLTFDDWGTDASINQLLYVLEKHHVKGTFFIRTREVAYNPNLLRKIALAGHSLASHTNTHMVLANREGEEAVYSELSDQQIAALREDLEVSYDVLTSIAGDVSVDGYPAVTTWFRPPTLAAGKNALEAVLDEGFTYILCGNISTHDYESPSAEVLYHEFREGLIGEDGKLINGSIIVMHMSADAKYTPEAIDLLLTENEAKADSDPTKFKVGDLNEYLAGGTYEANEKRN